MCTLAWSVNLNAGATCDRAASVVNAAEEVDAARDAALRLQTEHKIKEIGPIEVQGNVRSFMLRDLDANWWEISNTSGAAYDEAFARGDVSA